MHQTESAADLVASDETHQLLFCIQQEPPNHESCLVVHLKESYALEIWWTTVHFAYQSWLNHILWTAPDPEGIGIVESAGDAVVIFWRPLWHLFRMKQAVDMLLSLTRRGDTCHGAQLRLLTRRSRMTDAAQRRFCVVYRTNIFCSA